MGDDGQLKIDVRELDGVAVVRLVGTLDHSTYRLVHDVLLDHATTEPVGVVVELDELVVDAPALLVVFDAVWLSTLRWPGIPLLLAVSDGPVRELLDRKFALRHIPFYRTTAQALTAMVRPRYFDHVDAELPTCGCKARVAELIAERACLHWRLLPLLDVAPRVAVELLRNTAGQSASLLLRWGRDKLSVAVRTTCRVDIRHWHDLRHDIAGITGCSFSMGETPSSNGRHVVWAVLDVPA